MLGSQRARFMVVVSRIVEPLLRVFNTIKVIHSPRLSCGKHEIYGRRSALLHVSRAPWMDLAWIPSRHAGGKPWEVRSIVRFEA
jgi:hypothetical protein